MLKTIGLKPNDLEQIISEIYKTNVKFLVKSAAKVRKKEILLCNYEAQAILRAYETLLLESTKVIVSNIYSEVEKLVSVIVPKLQLNHDFIAEIIREEIDPIGELELDFEDVEIITGSQRFYDVFYSKFNLNIDYDLGDDLLLFKYNDLIKTVDFTSLHTNLIKDVLSCREKHLSMIDAIRMKV